MSAALSPIKQQEDSPQQRVASLVLPLDPLLTLAVIGLGICSIVTLSSATRKNITENPSYFVERQAIYLVLGLVLMVVLSRIDYGLLRRLKHWIYGALILSILAVIAVGSSTLGSTRAISLPLFSFQSSEVGKVLLIAFLACFFVDRSRRLRDRDTTIKALALALVPTMLVFAEPDIGSGLVYVAIAVVMLFVAGVPWKQLVALALLGVLALAFVLAVAPALGVHVLKPYQVERLTGFLHPTSNAQSKAYQQVQSKIAIGAGQQTGMRHLTPSSYEMLPEHETDFIFASLGISHGFVGAAVVLSLYALLIWRTLRILTMSKDLFGALIAGGVVAMLMFQVFVNVGMTVGIMPITGVTLPLMSYGGSSVITTMIAIGLLQSIYVRARSAESLKGRVLRW